MDVTYELWDIETGNIIGAFHSSNDALDVVETLLNAHGDEMANALVLQYRDEGAVVRTVGPGSELIDELTVRLKTIKKAPATA